MRTELYRHFDEQGRLLYVGVSWSAVARYGAGHRQTAHWADAVARIDVQHFLDRPAALIAERAAIDSEKPLYNNGANDPRTAPQKDAEISAGSFSVEHRTYAVSDRPLDASHIAFWGLHPQHVYPYGDAVEFLVRATRPGDQVVEFGKRLPVRIARELSDEGVLIVRAVAHRMMARRTG